MGASRPRALPKRSPPQIEAHLVDMPETMLSGDASDYEKMRAENMKRNQEIMKQLGLDQTDFRLHAAHKATKGGNRKEKGSAPASKKRKVEEEDGEKVTPQRRSSRQKGLPASEIKAEVLPDDDDRISAEVRDLRDLRGSKEGHALAEAEHLRWAGKQGKQTIVGTASYQHTLHRVMTMDEAALARRINAIERARGKFAVVKMRLFARVLCLEGYEDLSVDAAGALSRLIAVLGEPEGDDDVVDAVECQDANPGDCIQLVPEPVKKT